jgi:hypothetical protein
MLNQAFIAIIADRFNLSTKEVLNLSDWIAENIEVINELYGSSDYIETFQSFQRQEANEALARDFEHGRAFGFSEVQYDPKTGEQLPMEWMTPVEELASWTIVFNNL